MAARGGTAVLAGNHHRWDAWDGREELGHQLPSKGVGQLGAEEFRVPVRRQGPRHEQAPAGRRDDGVLLVQAERFGLQDVVLDGLGRHVVDPRPRAGGGGAGDVQREVVPGRDLPAGRAVPAERSDEAVERKGCFADQLGKASRPRPIAELDLEQPLRSRHVPLREVQVVQVPRVDVGDAPPVPPDLDGLPQPRDLHLAVDRREGIPGAGSKQIRQFAHPGPFDRGGCHGLARLRQA